MESACGLEAADSPPSIDNKTSLKIALRELIETSSKIKLVIDINVLKNNFW